MSGSNDHRDDCLTRDDARLIVKETLIQIGVDLENPIEFQADCQFVRKIRKTHEKVGMKIVLSMVGLFISGTVAIVVLGLSTWVRSKGS